MKANGNKVLTGMFNGDEENTTMLSGRMQPYNDNTHQMAPSPIYAVPEGDSLTLLYISRGSFTITRFPQRISEQSLDIVLAVSSLTS
jgi:hypothetical protein